MLPTGERLVPTAGNNDLRNEHMARYAFAEPLAAGRRVLDAGCGTGYGPARLAASALSVLAVDSAIEAILHGRATYPDVQFVQADCRALPITDLSVDLVVAFEVIEHLERWADLIREAARVLAEGGVFLVSTPNRPYYRTTRERANPFHVREFDYAEFRAALSEFFEHVEIFIENHVPAIAFTSEGRRPARTQFEHSRQDPEHANFFVAACSMSPLEAHPNFAFLPQCGNVLRERERHIAKLNEWIAVAEARHAEVEGSMSRELQRLPYRILRRIGLAPRLPAKWSESVRAPDGE